MTHPLSVRFRRSDVLDRLKAESSYRKSSTSAIAEELIEEGLRLRSHPMITFRDSASGRRAAIANGPDVWEIIGGIIGGDVPVDERVERAQILFGLPSVSVDAALHYYAEFSDEIDGEIASNVTAADRAEKSWQRRRQLLAG